MICGYFCFFMIAVEYLSCEKLLKRQLIFECPRGLLTGQSEDSAGVPKRGRGRRLLQVVARRYSRGPRGFKPGLMIFVLVGWSENVEGRRGGVGWRR